MDGRRSLSPEVSRAVDTLDVAIDGFLRFGGNFDDVVAALEHKVKALRGAKARIIAECGCANDWNGMGVFPADPHPEQAG